MFLDIDKQNSESIALIDDENNRITYGELIVIMKKVGKQVESRSLIFNLCKNNVGSMVGYLGFIEHDAVPVALSSKIDDDLLNNLINIYTPAYIWAPFDKAAKLKYNSIYQAYGYVLLKTGNDKYPMNDMLQFCMTTSGSTGSPKFVRYKKGNLEANAKNVAVAFGWSDKERSICDLAMNYTMGLNIINSHLSVGATCLLTDYNLMSAEFWNFIKKERGTNFCGVPFSYDLLARLHFDRMDLPDLTTITEGGGRLTDQRFKELAEYAERTGKRFIASFGTTETSARMACLPANLATTKTGSIGRAIPGGELFLIDTDGTVLTDPIAEGELCYKGPNVTMGYALSKDDLMKSDDFKGEYHTGDLAKRDADGCYYITGRLSRFLKLLSYRVSLDQCEQLIQQEFGIACACAGSDKRMNIFVEDDSNREKIISFITDKVGLYKSLFKVIKVPSILRTDTGKIKYKLMDEQYGK